MDNELLRTHVREVIKYFGPPSADLRARIAASIPPERVRYRPRLLHWVIGLIAIVLVSGIGGILVKDLRVTRPQPREATPSASLPKVNVSAFRGQGKLAFISSGGLYMLDGTAGVLRTVAETDASSPAWSPSGRWLLFSRGGRSWLAGPDGVARAISRQGRPLWSPVSDTLAGGDRDGLWVMPAGGDPRSLVPSPGGSPLWSPDGTTLAYTVVDQARNGHVFTVPAAGGTPRDVPLAIPQDVPGGTRLILAGWWSNGQGLLIWVNEQNSASLMADGLPLKTVPISGGSPRTLVHMLVNPSWLTWVGDRLMVVQGGDRLLWSNRTLALCDVQAASCRQLGQPPNTLSFDPAVSLDGTRIAFVRADAALSYQFDAETILARYATHTLWVADASGADPYQVLSARTGVLAPLWAKDGRYLLYVRDNALWLLALRGGAPVRVVEPLLIAKTPQTYYGQFSWQNLIAWHR